MFVDLGYSALVRVPGPDEIPQDSSDGYPKVIADQRELYGVTTVDEADQYQTEWLARKGLEPWPSELEVVPYINASRWVARCGCGTVNAVWDRRPSMTCLDCGAVSKVLWQSPWLRSAVIRVIAGWPPEHRSWEPGETVDQLERQGRLMEGVDMATANGLRMSANLAPPDDLQVR